MKRHHKGGAVARLGFLSHPPQNLLVSEMNPIKVSQADDWVWEARVMEDIPNDLHMIFGEVFDILGTQEQKRGTTVLNAAKAIGLAE